MPSPTPFFRIGSLLAIILVPCIATASQAPVALQTGELDRVRSSLIASGPTDTAWIGHVVGPTGLPGTPGGYGPYHIGRGPNRILWPPGPAPPPASYNGVWDFDNLQAGEADSTMGWTPVAPPYIYTATTERTDAQRPWFALDYGNQGNYVINQGAPKRTHGVIGYWHRDGGALLPPVAVGGTAPVPLAWAPIGGVGFSAWCGLRSHGDAAVVDPITGNPLNQTILQYTDVGPTDFPGYGSQWDQMMYRDVFVADGGGYALAFDYSTNMSTGELTESRSRTGWFEWDPLKAAVAGDGNFISSSTPGPPRPVDALQVWVGVPVEPVVGLSNDYVGSDGVPHDIYDPQRRWLSEVIRFNGPKMKLFEATGVIPAGPAPIAPLPGGLGTFVQSILDAQPGAGGLVRVVFRVKTNRGFDDQAGGFSSGTAGAAIIDNVIINAWPAASGNFEAAGSIDNSVVVAATLAWKTTGKPPGIYFHLHDIAAGLIYNDPCGPVGAATRHCNLLGAVASAGDHDNAEKTGGTFGSNRQDRRQWLASPTINLRSTGPGDYNGMGIDASIAHATGDYALWFDVYESVYDFLQTGNAYRVGWQSYPVLQPNGVPCWGPVQMPTSYTSSAGQPGCISGFGGGVAGAFARLYGLIRTSNPTGIPDSIRVLIETNSGCYTLPGLTSASCSPNVGLRAGAYFDNLSLAFIDAARSPRMSVGLWDLFNDAFPDNPGGVLPGAAAFNRLTARVKSGRNISQMTRSLLRHNIPGDSMVVTAPGPDTRTDLVFRIKPGPGNYCVVGAVATGLSTTMPPAGPCVPAVAGDGSFWGEYMGNTGVYGTSGGVPHDPDGPGPIAPGTQWDPNAWNSAQMDSAEMNIFPAEAVDPNLPRLTPGTYVSHYIESEVSPVVPVGPRAALGVLKPRCVLIACAPGSLVNETNIDCTPPLAAGCIGPVSGFDPAEVAGTLEYTKILPDGLFTPGTHIEYFFRRSKIGDPPTMFENMPDTAIVWPQLGEGPNFDGHRWQEFSVLPDKWKDPVFGGLGMACMLVVDLGDRRADELKWGVIAEAGGLTISGRRGAHNGYRAVNHPEGVAGHDMSAIDAVSRRDNAGQAGTLWDLYQVKGGESNVPAGRLGSRGASVAAPGLAAGKFSMLGPSGDMLRGLYKIVVLLGADLGAGSLGPILDQTDNDTGAITDFLVLPGGTALPRAFVAMGSNLVEGQADATYGHPPFIPINFRASLSNSNYRLFTGNASDVIDLAIVPPVSPPGGFTYGLGDQCVISNDVLTVEIVAPAGAAAAFYPPVVGPPFPPFVASVYTPASPLHPSATLVNSWTVGLSSGGFGSGPTLAHVGAAKYFNDLLTNAFGGLGCLPLGPPVGVGDQPGSSGLANYVSLRSSNPTRNGDARIAFGLSRTERVEVAIYDVTGRLVRRVANRIFKAGTEHVVVWDGTDEAGVQVGSGLYFYRLKTATFTSQRKLTLLRR